MRISNMDSVTAWDRRSFETSNILLAIKNAPLIPSWPYFMDMVKNDFADPGEVRTIELGSGFGKFSLNAGLLGCRTTMIDYNESTIEQVKGIFAHFQLKAEVRTGDALDLPDELSGQFDFSLSVGTAEHFLGEERKEIIRAHARVLKKGRRTFIVVPNARYFPCRIALGLQKLFGFWPENIPEVPFSRAEMLGLGRDAGLSNCRVVPGTFFGDDLHYWIGENVKSLLRKFTGYPRRIRESEKSFPNIKELIAALKNTPPHKTGFLDRHFCYSYVLVGEK
ncbi:MAG: class I SAM-dependent methyltransferase [Nitrospinota bacterium]|nr:class I SAM-dependent methyltransferase [Nitrospinota bacterium]